MDATPAAGGAGFIDLRKAPLPEVFKAKLGEEIEDEKPQEDPPDESIQNPEERAVEDVAEKGDLSSSSTSLARMELESERERKRSLKSYDFFNRKQRQRLEERAMPLPKAEEVPVGNDYDPDIDDFRTKPARQLSPFTGNPGDEAAEREAKRLRVIEEESADSVQEKPREHSIAYLAVESPKFLIQEAKLHYASHERGYQAHEVSESQFLFGVRRNDFQERYVALESNHWRKEEGKKRD